MPMPSTFRIPKAEIRGLYGKVTGGVRPSHLGQIPDNAYVYWHHQQVLKAVLSFEAKVAKCDRLDANLKSYAQLASAGVIGCSWCLDFGYFMAHNDGLDLAKVREVPRWRESDAFTPLERDVLEYAEAMSATPLTVTDEMVAQPDRRSSAQPAVVELTQMVALENMRSRFNSAAGLQSQGYSDVCELPARRTLAAHERDRTRRGFVAHRNLLFTVAYEMLGSAADAEDVLQETWLRWADVDRGEVRDAARLPGADHHPALPQPDPHAGPPPRGVRRPVAARAAAHHAGRRRGRRARRQRLDRDAAGAGDADARPSGRCSCSARSSTCRTTRSRRPSTRSPAAVRQIAHRAREPRRGPAAARGRRPRASGTR